jgi:hypothetical protein
MTDLKPSLKFSWIDNILMEICYFCLLKKFYFRSFRQYTMRHRFILPFPHLGKGNNSLETSNRVFSVWWQRVSWVRGCLDNIRDVMYCCSSETAMHKRMQLFRAPRYSPSLPSPPPPEPFDINSGKEKLRVATLDGKILRVIPFWLFSFTSAASASGDRTNFLRCLQ